MCLFKSYKDTKKKKKKGIDDFKCILQSCNSKASQSDVFSSFKLQMINFFNVDLCSACGHYGK